MILPLTIVDDVHLILSTHSARCPEMNIHADSTVWTIEYFTSMDAASSPAMAHSSPLFYALICDALMLFSSVQCLVTDPGRQLATLVVHVRLISMQVLAVVFVKYFA